MPRLREPRPQPQPLIDNSASDSLLSGDNEANEMEAPHNTEPFEAKTEVKQEKRFGEEEPAPKPQPKEKPLVAEEETPQEDNSLLKQIEALKKSEELHKRNSEQYQRERDEARAQAQERGTEASERRKESLQYQLDSISTAMGAAQSEAEAAKRDIKTAIGNGDSDAQAEALDRLAIARANIAKLEDGKFELEARIKEPEPEPRVQQTSDPIDNLNIPASAKSWLKEHPEYVTNPRLNAKIQYLHHEVLEEGHRFGDPAYFESLETKLGLRDEQQEEEADNAPPPPPVRTSQRTHIVSAPVSRETPSSSGTRNSANETLTKDEREAAKIAGITEAEYAKQKRRIREMKANGSYGGQQ